ncbi:MAG: ABC transporter permease [Candidatus Schekmanbacteria bacterium]|nr:MAG: ABC transporter permease [Candidatus Schekmanbacteria bacterium]
MINNTLKAILRNRLALIGFIIVSIFFLTALFAPFLTPYNIYAQNLEQRLSTPSASHPLGLDELGRDILSRIIYGSRVSLKVGVITVTISSIVGLLIGTFAGFIGGKVDEIIMRIIDILLAFPGILLAIAIIAIVGPGIDNVIFALCIVGWVGYARLVRGQTLSIRENEYVLAAKALGAPAIRTILFYIIPNLLSPLLVQATLGIAGAIVAEASLSFLGLGVQAPTPSWGSMLNDGQRYLSVAPHLTAFPGLAIMVVVMGFNFLGDGMRDILDPRSNSK